MRAHLLLGVLLSFSGNAYSALPKMMIIITHGNVETSNLDSVREMGITSYSMNIHAPSKLSAELNSISANSEEELKSLAIQRLSAMTEEEKLSYFRPGILIKKLGIEKLPVVIFDDGSELIYGVTDFLDALDIWEQTR